jgi:hypothetical protein
MTPTPPDRAKDPKRQVIFRKGEDDSALRLRASFEPQGFDFPETVKAGLDNPNARVFVYPHDKTRTPHLSENYHEPFITEEINEEDGGIDEIANFASYYNNREYPVSGSDIAKLKRGR